MQDDIIKQAIAQRAGERPDSGHVADAVVDALRLLHAELGLLVGTQAAAALCSHALHRTRLKVEWTTPPSAVLSDQMLVALRSDLHARTLAQAIFAGETLLFALVDHLISLIGEPLTHRMLQSAWGASVAVQTSRENL